MKTPATTLVTFSLCVIFFVESVTCPSTSAEEKVELVAELSKVIVRRYATGIVHVYNNAALYSIKRPIYVRLMSSDIKWFTIRVRKSPKANFRTLADMCGKEVEFSMITEKIVKFIFNEDYEYTLHFNEAARVVDFVHPVYEVSKNKGKEMKYGLNEAAILRADDSRRVVETFAKLVQRRVSDQKVLWYVRSSRGMIRIMLPSGHFVISQINHPYEVSVIPMVVRGQPLNYQYRLTFQSIPSLKTFLAIAKNHQFEAENLPDSEPQDTGNSDESFTSDGYDFYDEDELRFFREKET